MLSIGVSSLLDRSAAWVLRTLRSLGYGVVGTTFALLGALVPLLLVSIGLSMVAKPAGLLPLVLVMVVLQRMTQIVKRLGRATAAQDMEEAARLRRLIDGEGPPRNRTERSVRILGDAEALLAAEKWAEARDLFATIEVDALVAIAQPGVVSELGYATAHAGQPAEGVEHLLRAVRMADAQPKYPRTKRWFVDQRLGVALSLAGRHDEAITVLDDVTSNGGGEPRPWTEALYFMAQSFAALGVTDASVDLLSLAARDGDGAFKARARAALEIAKSHPHRAEMVVREPEELEDDEESRAKRRRV